MLMLDGYECLFAEQQFPDVFIDIAALKGGIARDDDFSPGLDDAGDVVRVDAAVDLDPDLAGMDSRCKNRRAS